MQVLETWEPGEYETALLPVEQALTSASEDALSETRAIARQLFGAFGSCWQHRVHDLLQQMRPNLQAKIIDAIASYSSGGPDFLSSQQMQYFLIKVFFCGIIGLKGQMRNCLEHSCGVQIASSSHQI